MWAKRALWPIKYKLVFLWKFIEGNIAGWREEKLRGKLNKFRKNVNFLLNLSATPSPTLLNCSNWVFYMVTGKQLLQRFVLFVNMDGDDEIDRLEN